MKRFDLLCILFTIATPACGSDGSGLDLSSRDPRCVASCPQTMPEYDGVGAVCDTPSRVQCLDECEARIAGLATVCQSCLLEHACFDPDGCFGPINAGDCTQTTCTLTSDFGTCSYQIGDHAAELACLKTVDPRRSVTCQATFRPATECASVCT
jgi:hypothetical protein